jgi:hypothetical protein
VTVASAWTWVPGTILLEAARGIEPLYAALQAAT